jgi:endonuclease-3
LNRPRRRKEKAAEKAARAAEILSLLREAYPGAHCALNHRNAFELLVATILSAQCTDARVNMVTPSLFERYPGPEDLAGADGDELEEMIRSTGFFRNKRKSLIGMATALVEKHGGQVPARMDALVLLPGVGRKTANVILGNAFGINEGIVVDTHVGRLARRLGLTVEEDPVKVETELMPLFPRESWADLAHLLITHGRAVCLARGPRCAECFLVQLCPTGKVVVGGSFG